MKKLFHSVLTLILITSFLSCSNDDENQSVVEDLGVGEERFIMALLPAFESPFNSPDPETAVITYQSYVMPNFLNENTDVFVTITSTDTDLNISYNDEDQNLNEEFQISELFETLDNGARDTFFDINYSVLSQQPVTLTLNFRNSLGSNFIVTHIINF